MVPIFHLTENLRFFLNNLNIEENEVKIMSKCPRCGCERFRYELRSAGTERKTNSYRTGVKSSWIFASNKKETKSNRIQKTIGFCPDCGYMTDKPLDQQRVPSKYRGPITIIKLGIIFMIAAIILSIIGNGSKNDKTNVDSIPGSESNPSNNSDNDVGTNLDTNQSDEGLAENTNVEKSEEWITAELKDFEYRYKDDGIVLEKYRGIHESVIIPSFYEVENTILPVLSLNDTFKDNRYIKNLIISDGLNTVSSSTFNHCEKLKHIYIPSSIKHSTSAITFIEDGDVLYYGGTEEQWNKVNNNHWSDIHFKRVIFNATTDDCLNNKDNFVVDVEQTIASDCTPLSDFRYDLIDG